MTVEIERSAAPGGCCTSSSYGIWRPSSTLSIANGSLLPMASGILRPSLYRAREVGNVFGRCAGGRSSTCCTCPVRAPDPSTRIVQSWKSSAQPSTRVLPKAILQAAVAHHSHRNAVLQVRRHSFSKSLFARPSGLSRPIRDLDRADLRLACFWLLGAVRYALSYYAQITA